MANRSLSSSERRGIIVVAALALIITGAGLLPSRCSRLSTTSPPSPEIHLLPGSRSPDPSPSDSSSPKRKRAKSKAAPRKAYPSRSPLDEPV